MFKRLQRLVRLPYGICRELLLAWRHCAGTSVFRYGSDIFLYRYIRLRQPKRFDSLRRIRLRNGVDIVYRLNRGDIQTVREVWFQEVYRLPFPLPGSGGLLIDLGGNIGLTTIYLMRRHGFNRAILVEPLKENVELARLNCELNGVEAEIVEAAVGPRSGWASFVKAENHNQGRLVSKTASSFDVRVVTVDDLAGDSGVIRLVKVDIEGGEQALLSEERSWLARVNALVAEFHGELVDYPNLVESLRRSGFECFPAGSGHQFSTDAFLRRS